MFLTNRLITVKTADFEKRFHKLLYQTVCPKHNPKYSSPMFDIIVLLLCSVSIVLSTQQPSLTQMSSTTQDYDLITPVDESSALKLSHYSVSGFYASTGRPYSAYVAVFPSDRFAFYPSSRSENGCVELIKTSVASSQNYDCEYATNGAFFGGYPPSYCIGNLVSDSKVWQLPTDGSGTNRANFGILSSGQIVTGFLNQTTVNTSSFSQLITGWGWLVRNGISNVRASQDLSFGPDGFTYEKAPRTAVGAFANGTMILLQIDGEEDINAGPDLFETAELLVKLGVESAINIDGGGSSTSVYEGQVVDQPTCHDTPIICERAVASIACVKAA